MTIPQLPSHEKDRFFARADSIILKQNSPDPEETAADFRDVEKLVSIHNTTNGRLLLDWRKAILSGKSTESMEIDDDAKLVPVMVNLLMVCVDYRCCV